VALQKIWLNRNGLFLMTSFSITLMMGWPVPQIAFFRFAKRGAQLVTDRLARLPGSLPRRSVAISAPGSKAEVE
jgi:hypothetical protein